ncbi:MAG: purine-nucleoside phosphorylase [Bacteroidales bacterium]|nr:purine-nucleoside phosphorylase [Bacteroidales bacterium]
MLEAINETISFIKDQITQQPEIAIILGTGLGAIADEVEAEKIIPYEKIPHFPVSTVAGHDGKLIIGRYAGKEVIVLKGRFHYYEGYSMQEVTFPVRVLKFLGIKNLFLSNAAGGMNPDFEVGDVMFINDHISLMPNPLIGVHDPAFGDRFPDMSEVYNRELIKQALLSATKHQLRAHKGCYVGVTGPTLETPKEYEYFRIIGGDAVGMSTVPEATIAHQMGMNIFAVSVITDLGVPGKIEKISHEIVQQAAEKVTPKLVSVINEVISGL